MEGGILSNFRFDHFVCNVREITIKKIITISKQTQGTAAKTLNDIRKTNTGKDVKCIYVSKNGPFLKMP